MFDIPDSSDLARMVRARRQEWLDESRRTDVLVVGGDLAGLTASRVLQAEGYQVVVVEESEQMGGRLTWDRGPVPIFYPADETLEELGHEPISDPPVWVDRVALVATLLHRFFDQGGQVLPGVFVEGPPRFDSDRFDLTVSLGDETEVLNTGDVIVTIPKFTPGSPPKPGQTPLEEMVLATGRRQDDWIQAGYQALKPSLRDGNYPYENASLLSGRKAAEVILNPEA